MGAAAKAKAKGKAKAKAASKAVAKATVPKVGAKAGASKAGAKAGAKPTAKAAASGCGDVPGSDDGQQAYPRWRTNPQRSNEDPGGPTGVHCHMVSTKASVLDCINEKDGLGKNGAQAVMDHLKGMAKKDPTKASLIDHWKSLPRGDAKLDFALKLKVGREACFVTLSETHETGIQKKSRVMQFWLTEDQVAKEEGLHNYLDNPVQQQKLKDILEGLPCRPHERSDLAAKLWKQYDYSQKMVQMDQYNKTSMSLRGEAEVQDHRDFDQMAQQLCDAIGLSSPVRQATQAQAIAQAT
jgi:hypothetical protein